MISNDSVDGTQGVMTATFRPFGAIFLGGRFARKTKYRKVVGSRANSYMSAKVSAIYTGVKLIRAGVSHHAHIHNVHTAHTGEIKSARRVEGDMRPPRISMTLFYNKVFRKAIPLYKYTSFAMIYRGKTAKKVLPGSRKSGEKGSLLYQLTAPESFGFAPNIPSFRVITVTRTS